MGQPIIKLSRDGRDYYLIWSSVVDAPITPGMSLVKLYQWIRTESGQAGIDALEERLARVEAKGTSCLSDRSAAETIAGNRAGPDESCLTMSQIIDTYCLAVT